MAKKPVVAAEPSDEETVGTGNDDRIARLNAIGDNLDRGRADEFADVNDDETTTAFVAPPAEEDDVVAEELARAEAEANLTAEPGEETPVVVEPKIKVKLGNQEVELTQAELIARAQEAEAAKAEVKQLKEAAAKPAAVVEPESKPNSQLSPEDRAAAEAAEQEERRALARAIQVGTEEEAMAALEQMQERGNRRQRVDADATAKLVDERMSFKEAATWFATEYEDIVSDQTLLDLALKRDQELVASGDRRTYRERYQEIGGNLRIWVKGLREPSVPQPAEGSPEAHASTEPNTPTRVDRKAAAAVHAAPAASSVRAPKAAGSGEEKEETTQETIAKMKESRGGPQWLRG